MLISVSVWASGIAVTTGQLTKKLVKMQMAYAKICKFSRIELGSDIIITFRHDIISIAPNEK